MALIIPVGFAQAVYVHSWLGDAEPMVVTMGLELPAIPADPQEVANQLHEHYATHIANRLGDPVTFELVTLYVGTGGGPSEVYDSIGDPVSGTAFGSTFPPNTAYLVRKRTGAAGRRGRGRMYFPGVGEGAATNLGKLDTVWQATLQGHIDDWFEAMTTDNMNPVILHRSEGEGVEPPPTPITVLQLDDTVATQRQRLRK